MDAEAKPVRTGGPQELPGVESIEINPVRFNPPTRFYRKGELVEQRDAIELLIKTTGPLPNLDLTPVLFIGDIAVDEYARVGTNLYRFVAYQIERLVPGARIALGWPYAPQLKIPTDFNFQLPGPVFTS